MDHSKQPSVVGLSEATSATIRASSGITLGRVLANQARIRSDEVAVVFPGGSYTYTELNRRANVIANALLARGIQTGDRIAVLSENRVEYVVLLYAAAKIGVAVAALNWRQTAVEVAGCIDLVGPTAVVLSGQFEGLLHEASKVGSGQSSAQIISFDSMEHEEAERFADLESDGTTSDPGVEFSPESCATILYTSGTTGPSKGAAISHRALVARAGMMAAELRLSKDDAFIGWAPMFHMVTTDYMFITAILGGTFVVVPGFDVEQIVQTLCEYRVGWFVLVPGTVDAIINNLQETGRRPLGITAVGAMADLIPAARIAELTLLLDCPFFNSFGSTETGTIPSAGALLAPGVPPVDFGKEQSAFCDVLIRTKDGREAGVDEEGELLLRGLTMFSGYWNDEKASAETFGDGWYHTGDIFTRSADGKLHFAGRERYMIKSGGENVYPAEIERVLLSHDAVEEAVVARARDDRWGEVPRAFVALKPGSDVTRDQLLAFCDGKLARFMLPKWIEFLPESEFPRNSTGKVLRAELERIPMGGADR
jgi:acyl-CoA synthetase (AMP-forming)/AMP-acid ligase II